MPYRKSKKYKGGNPQQFVPANPQPEKPSNIPVQTAPKKPVVVSQGSLVSFPKKIRLNITSDLKSVIEAPKEGEYILTERVNVKQKYNLDSIYQPTFGKDEQTGTPIDVYSEYVYERLKDMNNGNCQQLKHRGDKKIPGGFFSKETTLRSVCNLSIKSLVKEDNRILQQWVDNIKKNGIDFLEDVAKKIEESQEKIKDLESSKKDKLIELDDATNTLEQNKQGIARETNQRLQEITRIISDKEDNMGSKIDNEINDLQKFIKEETKIIQEIEATDKAIEDIEKEISDEKKKLNKMQNGLNKNNAFLAEQGFSLDDLINKIENSILQFSMIGGRKKRKCKKKMKKKMKSKKRGRPKKVKK